MQPGRFVSLLFLYLGTMMLSSFVLGVTFGELEPQLSLATLGWLLPGIGTLILGLDRIRNPEQEAWPSEFDLWTCGAVVFLAGYTGWFLYVLVVDLL